jgi:hypothetical protein
MTVLVTVVLFFKFVGVVCARDNSKERDREYVCVCLRESVCVLRPCVPLTQLVELDFRELLDLTLTKVVIGYITCELYITSFVENNEFLAIITSFLTKIVSFLTKVASFLTKMTFKTRYITEITIKLVI